MGFAVYPDTAAAAGVEVDELTRSLVASSTSAVGNAMHVGNIGTMIAVVIATAEWVPGPHR